MPRFKWLRLILIAIWFATTAHAAEPTTTTTATRPMHGESARKHEKYAAPSPAIEPAIPEGMTLDHVFDYSETPPPADYPDVVPDDQAYVFTLIEQLEYRFVTDDNPDHLGWEAQGWIGTDYHKLWWKNEGEAVFEGKNEGESETDLLYSRLITPFWNAQVGVQYANEWHDGDYDDRWSAALSLQGLAPYKFELDNSLYISEDGDVTVALEAEYNVRITQRLVLQPRTEIGIAADDIPERELGAGITDVTLDLRLRYEILREFAPYIGIRYHSLIGETEDIAKEQRRDSDQFAVTVGLRFAF